MEDVIDADELIAMNEEQQWQQLITSGTYTVEELTEKVLHCTAI